MSQHSVARPARTRGAVEGSGQLAHIQERHIALPSLHCRNVGPVQTRSERQLLLRPAQVKAGLAHSRAKPL
jgi:hypothetical protein